MDSKRNIIISMNDAIKSQIIALSIKENISIPCTIDKYLSYKIEHLAHNKHNIIYRIDELKGISNKNQISLF